MKANQIILVLLSLIFWTSVNARSEEYTERVEGAQIYNGSTFFVEDDQYDDMTNNPTTWSSNYLNLEVKNKVRLGVNHDALGSGQFTGSITLNVTYHKWVSGAFVQTTVPKTLTVSYDGVDPTQLIDDQSTYLFDDAHKIEVEVASISGLNPGDIYLEAIIEVQRCYTFDGGAVQGAGYQIVGNNYDYIRFFWDEKYGAEEYELEWVHIQDYTINTGVYLLPTELNYDFYLNSTRITLKENKYEIPKIFDRGYVIFRVRAIGNQGGNCAFRYEGEWNADDKGLVSNILLNQKVPIQAEYDAGMNWAHQVGYTEDGKRMESVSFIDGLGRGRQTVGHNTETDQAVVSNVYYDEIGRPAVSDLPTPVDGEELRHYEKFNRPVSDNLVGYQAGYFNEDNLDPEMCDVSSQAFATNSGAGQYYSEMNPDKDGENAFIPDAQGYPFTRVTYLDDYTNRTLRTSGAGQDLKIGSGHETRYIYPSTNQNELNKLFGTEVGNADHYQRIITVDPNEQVYVQYLDMAGRVVASYMMGPTPESLDPIFTGNNQPETIDILIDGVGQTIDPSVPSSHILELHFMPEDDTYTFNYAFDPMQYQSACLPQGICLDCVYDIELTVRDHCGAIVSSHITQINGQTFDEICNGSGTHNFTEQIALIAGEYTIEKTLTVNQDALNDYWCIYASNEDCNQSFISDQFNTEYVNEPFDDCNIQQSTAQNECEVLESILLEDVTPGGQYALYTISGGVYSLTDQASLDVFGANWQSGTYHDANGQLLDISSWTLTDFIQNFLDEWAYELLPYHPEACYLDFCNTMGSSQSYEDAMMASNDYQQALTSGYFNPLGNTTTGVSYLDNSANQLDPFFNTGGIGNSYSSAMAADMDSYIELTYSGIQIPLSMWEYAVYLSLGCEPSNAVACIAMFDPTRNCASEDLVWVEFRKLYLELRESYVYQAQQAHAAQNNCDNECIGSQAPGCTTFANKVPRIPNGNLIVGTTGTSIDDILNSANPATVGQQVYDQMVADACQISASIQADNWIAQLSGCDFVATNPTINMTELKNDMIALISSGCDGEHPMGASTTPTGIVLYTATTNTSYGTLDELLSATEYLGPNYESNLCTPLLISAPGPYQTSVEMESLINGPLDTCGCDQVYEAYAYADLNTITVEAALSELTGITLQDADYLICACDKYSGGYSQWSETSFIWPTTANDDLATEGIMIPNEMSCDECNLSCTDVLADIAILEAQFPNSVPFSDATNYETILTNYLNQKYNYTLTAHDYETFIRQCDANNNPWCELNPIMNDWSETMTLVAHRGQLENTSAASVDLQTENIVYSQNTLSSYFAGDLYWSSLNGNTLSLHYGLVGDDCSIDLTGDTDFDFSSIVSFGAVMPLTTDCNTNNNTFEVEVIYLDCGAFSTTTLSGVSNCFNVVECLCDTTGLTLCNKPSSFQEDPCYEPRLSEMYLNVQNAYLDNMAQVQEDFIADYNQQCSQAFATEDLSFTGNFETYQYTLFYYDQAGNLVQTIAPEGVKELPSTQFQAINDARNNVANSSSTTAIVPEHEYLTTYEYNSFNQLVKTTNPDQDGDSEYWYDLYGRIIASQNPVQASQNKYSYSLYDPQGRPVEVGQVETTQSPATLNFILDQPGVAVENWVLAGSRTEVTRTQYDFPMSAAIQGKFSNGMQENLRLRVASVFYYTYVLPTTNLETDYESATHYSYDLHGNVIEQIQDIPMMAPVDQDVKRTQYEFELISGNVSKVIYQADELDEFEHEYTYDQLNRLTEVKTSADDVHEARDAKYHYYDYGPLARMEVGEYDVQGTDYAYTINGWIKGMNSAMLDANQDMGGDGVGNYYTADPTAHSQFANDVNAWSLGYFKGDHKTISNENVDVTMQGTDAFYQGTYNLYNGNISYTVNSIYQMTPMGNAYRYDQLNRLVRMTGYYNFNTDNSWSNMVATQDYHNAYTYDKNGNIMSLQRNGTQTSGLLMDLFTYEYKGLDGVLNASSNSKSNRLNRVIDDGADDATVDPTVGDIKSNMMPDNYDYDALGQLTHDEVEGIETIEWRLGDKKMKSIIRTNADQSSSQLEFVYNPFGIRVLKVEKPRVNGNVVPNKAAWKYTYYGYDANGQTMAVYDVTMDPNGANIAVIDEHHIYGSSRLGMLKKGEVIYDNFNAIPPLTDVRQHTLGLKRYECTNHLGNVQAVINDRKIPASVGAVGTHEAGVLMTADYYPFGMIMPGGCYDVDIATCATPPTISQGATISSDDFSTHMDTWIPNDAINADVQLDNGELSVSSLIRYKCGVKTFETVPGETYTVSFDLTLGTLPNGGNIGSLYGPPIAPGGSITGMQVTVNNVGQIGSFLANGSYTAQFTATDKFHSISFCLPNIMNNTDPLEFWLDNVVITGAEEIQNCPATTIIDDDYSSGTMDGWYAVGVPTPSPTVSGGVVNFNSVTRYDGMEKSIATVPGEEYKVNFTLDLGTMERIQCLVMSGPTNSVLLIKHFGNGANSFTFTATDNATKIRFRAEEPSSSYFNAMTRNYGVDQVNVLTYSSTETFQVCRDRIITDSYRYAYNGMEVDNEVSGNGNSYTTEFRQYDPRLGRWKSLDPLMAKFPWMSPYTAFDNNPIFYVDPVGAESEGHWFDQDGNYIGDDGQDDDKVYIANVSEHSSNYGEKNDQYAKILRMKYDAHISDDRSYLTPKYQEALKNSYGIKYDIGYEEFISALDDPSSYSGNVSISNPFGGSLVLNGNQQNQTTSDIDHQSGWFIEYQVSAYVCGGASYSIGLVGDSYGNMALYNNVSGGLGFGGGFGFDGGVIQTTDGSSFTVDDFDGRSTSFKAALGPINFSMAGDDPGGNQGFQWGGVKYDQVGGLAANAQSLIMMFIKFSSAMKAKVEVNYSWGETTILKKF